MQNTGVIRMLYRGGACYTDWLSPRQSVVLHIVHYGQWDCVAPRTVKTLRVRNRRARTVVFFSSVYSTIGAFAALSCAVWRIY